MPLKLRAGDVVEVRSKEEILATLDANGARDALPFMPEMLRYCGQRFPVSKRAHKTCDTIWKTGARRMADAVHLDDLRCDGSAHGGCQAGCLIFWKEAWLKRADGSQEDPVVGPADEQPSGGCSEEALHLAARRTATTGCSEVEAFSCQTTALFEATTPLRWFDLRQYVSDITSGNIGFSQLARGSAVALFNMAIRRLRAGAFAAGRAVRRRRPAQATTVTAGQAAHASGDRARRAASDVSTSRPGLRDAVADMLVEYPSVRGRLQKTPSIKLDLMPGEYVQVKSKEEIVATLDVHNRNRGLLFDVEMVPYCGGTYRVLRRVERILDERTGIMRRLPNACIVLDEVVCGGCLSRNRLFCPRAISPYWHEIWLQRASRTDAR